MGKQRRLSGATELKSGRGSVLKLGDMSSFHYRHSHHATLFRPESVAHILNEVCQNISVMHLLHFPDLHYYNEEIYY